MDSDSPEQRTRMRKDQSKERGALCFLERKRGEASWTLGLWLYFPFLLSPRDTFLGWWLFLESQT